jgi:single stranded DNA-binding protein
MAFAKVMIIGNLGRDPEMRYTPNGRQVTEFSVAVTHRGRDPQTGDWADQGTDWYRVTIWGDRAERAAEQFRKGNRVFVEGRFRTREYDAKDGTHRTCSRSPRTTSSRRAASRDEGVAVRGRGPGPYAGRGRRRHRAKPVATPRGGGGGSTTPSSTTCPSET